MAATAQPNPGLDPRMGMSSRSARARKSFWRRGPLGIFIVAVHAVLIYVAATTMGILKAPDFAKPIEAIFIDQPQEQHEPVKVIKPELETPVVDPPPIEDTIPEIEVPVDQPAPAAITAETSPAPPAETSDMKVTNRVDPVYPPASRRAGEEGTGVFRVLVDTNGRPLEVQVMKSSGFPRLDEAAVTAIHKWRFRAAVANGQAVQSWTRVQVQFRLENA
jgi:periplasmic protein TonB